MNSGQADFVQLLWKVGVGDEVQTVLGQRLLFSFLAEFQHHVDLILPPSVGEPRVGEFRFEGVNVPR